MMESLKPDECTPLKEGGSVPVHSLTGENSVDSKAS